MAEAAQDRRRPDFILALLRESQRHLELLQGLRHLSHGFRSLCRRDERSALFHRLVLLLIALSRLLPGAQGLVERTMLIRLQPLLHEGLRTRIGRRNRSSSPGQQETRCDEDDECQSSEVRCHSVNLVHMLFHSVTSLLLHHQRYKCSLQARSFPSPSAAGLFPWRDGITAYDLRGMRKARSIFGWRRPGRPTARSGVPTPGGVRGQLGWSTTGPQKQ